MEKARPRPPAGPDGGRGHPVPPGVDVGVDITGEQLRDRYDAVVLAVGATVAARPAGARAASSTACTAGDGVPAAGQPGRRSASTVEGQVTAEGKDVVDHRRRRHRRRLPGHRAPAGRPLGHPAGDHAAAAGDERPDAPAVADLPDALPVASAHEEGGERVYARHTKRVRRRRATAGVRALRLVEVERGRAGSQAVEGTEREIPAQLVLLAMGFIGPAAGRAWSSSSGSSWTSAATSRGTTTS